MRVIVPLSIAMAMVFVSGCGAAPEPVQDVEDAAVVEEPVWLEVSVDGMSASQQAQLELGRTAQQAMAKGLMGALMAALDEGGPPAAIQVCHDEAGRIAAEQAAASGVKLGRTSLRLRNPVNVAPEWAEELVVGRAAEPTYLAGPAGELAGLLPIVLNQECTMCHGSSEQIDEAVAAQIAEHYSGDQAIDFAAGDLRGWFWFEVPAAGE